jgi:serine O-acetyltransferase
VKIGNRVRIGANAVVTEDIPDDSVVVGVPGRVVARNGKKIPKIDLEHGVLPDPIRDAIGSIDDRLRKLEEELSHSKGS